MGEHAVSQDGYQVVGQRGSFAGRDVEPSESAPVSGPGSPARASGSDADGVPTGFEESGVALQATRRGRARRSRRAFIVRLFRKFGAIPAAGLSA